MNNINPSKGGYSPPSSARLAPGARAPGAAAAAATPDEVPAAVRHRLAQAALDAKAPRLREREVAPARHRPAAVRTGPDGSAQASDGPQAPADTKSAKASRPGSPGGAAQGDAGKGGTTSSPELPRQILAAAMSELPQRQVRGAVAALAHTLGGPTASREVLDRLVAALVDVFFAAPFISLRSRGPELLAGVLQGVCGGQTDREAIVLRGLCQGLLEKHSAAYRASLGSGAELEAEHLRTRLDVVSEGAGGREMSPARLGILLDGVHAMQASASHEVHEDPLQPEDLALAVGDICHRLGGAQAPAILRASLLAHAADPQRQYDGNQRGCLVYHLCAALDVHSGPPALRQEVLQAFADQPALSQEAVGYMAWGLGMHLLGVNPDAMPWHEEHADLVCASAVPVRQVVHAVMVQARSLPAASAERVVLGLYRVADELQATASAHAKLALRNAITRSRPHCAREQIAAMRAAYARAQAAAEIRHAANAQQADAAAGGRRG